MSVTRYSLLGIIVIAGLAVVAGVIWLVTQSTPSRTLTFPNGQTARLLGTTVGYTNFSTQKNWHRLVRRFLPGPLQGWIPPTQTGSCGGGSNALTLYFEMIPPTAAGGGVPWSQLAAVDDEGLEYNSEGGSCSWGGGPGGTTRIHGTSLRAFPRRQREFDLRFYDAKRNLLGKIRVPNPVRGPFPTWQAERLPSARTNGPVVLTLNGLIWNRWVRPSLDLHATEENWKRARWSYITYSDASGNEGQYLSPREPAWKLATVVHRQHSDDFAPNERLIITNLTVPTAGEFTALNARAECGGIGIFVHGIAGPGYLRITNGTQRGMAPPSAGQSSGWSTSSDGKTRIESWGSAEPFFLIEVSKLTDADEVRFNYSSSTSERIPFDESRGYYGDGTRPGVRIYFKPFKPPENVEQTQLEIIVSRGREFEFIFNPAEIQKESKP